MIKKETKNPFMKEIFAYLHLLFEVWGHSFQPFWGSPPCWGLLLVPFFGKKIKPNKCVNCGPRTSVCVCALVTTPFVAFQGSSETNKLTDWKSQLQEGKPVGHFISAALAWLNQWLLRLKRRFLFFLWLHLCD